MTLEILQEMKNIDIKIVDKDSLQDIQKVSIDNTLPKQERILQFIKQIGNPYLHKCGDVVVKNTFSQNGNSLEDAFKSYLRKLAN